MKTLTFSLALLLGFGVFPAPQASQTDDRFGDMRFAPFEGVQLNWPKAENTRIIQDHAVPIYLGLPMRNYYVMGRIHVPHGGSVAVVKQGPSEEIFNETGRQRDCANLARHLGGNAVIVTAHPNILRAFNLSKEELEKTAPLLAYQAKLVLVIQFESGLASRK